VASTSSATATNSATTTISATTKNAAFLGLLEQINLCLLYKVFSRRI
jgi:hypothetical protein